MKIDQEIDLSFGLDTDRGVEPMKKKAQKEKTESSMSYASQPICKEEACIGEMTGKNHAGTNKPSKKEEQIRKHTTRSSMNFGNKAACSDEECIGKS